MSVRAVEQSRSDWRAVIEGCGLPQPLRDRVERVTRATRLWRSEKREVALELIAHFADGLEAGRSAEQLQRSFGDPAVAAKLIRRAKKRNRPLWWRAQRRMQQAVLALIVFYAGLWCLYALQRPRVTVDYLAKLNAPAVADPIEQQAWPIYRAAWIADFPGDVKFDEVMVTGENHSRFVQPGERGWEKVQPLLSRHAGLMEAAHRGSALPSLGLALRPASQIAEEDRRALWRDVASSPRDDADLLYAILLPHLAHFRTIARLLQLDMLLAASQGDSGRVVRDVQTLVGLARQLRQHPFLINDGVAIAQLGIAQQGLMGVLHDHPQALRTDDLSRLDALLVEAGTLYTARFEGESYAFNDLVQRIYSDDGQGDGRVTLKGLKLLHNTLWWSEEREFLHGLQIVALPLSPALVPSRREVTDEHNRIFAEQEARKGQPLWQFLKHQKADDERLLQSLSARRAFDLVRNMTPAFSAIHRTMGVARARTEALRVVIALERWRREHGSFPQSLSELVPTLLPGEPVDHSTGQPLLYKLVDGQPLLYGRGLDGDDDGGQTDETVDWPRLPEKGDWVLYPMPVKPPVGAGETGEAGGVK